MTACINQESVQSMFGIDEEGARDSAQDSGFVEWEFE